MDVTDTIPCPPPYEEDLAILDARILLATIYTLSVPDDKRKGAVPYEHLQDLLWLETAYSGLTYPIP
jgi:hypothetical protein